MEPRFFLRKRGATPPSKPSRLIGQPGQRPQGGQFAPPPLPSAYMHTLATQQKKSSVGCLKWQCPPSFRPSPAHTKVPRYQPQHRRKTSKKQRIIPSRILQRTSTHARAYHLRILVLHLSSARLVLPRRFVTTQLACFHTRWRLGSPSYLRY